MHNMKLKSWRLSSTYSSTCPMVLVTYTYLGCKKSPGSQSLLPFSNYIPTQGAIIKSHINLKLLGIFFKVLKSPFIINSVLVFFLHHFFLFKQFFITFSADFQANLSWHPLKSNEKITKQKSWKTLL